MVDTRISALPVAGVLDGTEVLPIVQASTSKQVSVAAIRASSLDSMMALSGGLKAQTISDMSAMPNNQSPFFTSTSPYIFKMWTPVPISITQVYLPLTGTASALSGWYTAFYDGTGTLINNSTSPDLSTILTSPNPVNFNINSGGTAISIAAGYFYLSFKMGTATTYPKTFLNNGALPNLFTTSGVASDGATTFRNGFGANSWTGAVAPATIGTISSDYRGYVWGVR